MKLFDGSQGMLRLSPDAMRKLFLPTIQKIKEKIGSILNNNIAGKLDVMISHSICITKLEIHLA
jgi:hypothetical protein